MRLRRAHGLLFWGLLVGLILGVWIVWPRPNTVRLPHGQRIVLEIQRTREEREQGLSGRASLPEGHGMLFLFDGPGRYPFWMPDMRFPIDIVYFREKRVTEVFPNVPFPGPGEDPVSIEPFMLADRVLELRQGEAARYGLVPGVEVPDLP